LTLRRAASPTLLAAALLVCGCGGGGSSGHTTSVGDATTSPPPQTTGPTGPPSRRCGGLSSATVARIAGLASVTAQALAPDPRDKQACGTIFIDGTGSLVVQVTARPGGATDLRQAARVAAASGGASPLHVRSLAGLGSGAFIAGKRVIGFRRGGRVITVQTGYDRSGRLSVGPAQLARLARTAGAGF